jgi:tRNA(Ile)-lysidine synthase
MTSGPLDPAVAKARTLARGALADVQPGDRVVAAVSGGADSLALAVTMAFLAPREGWQAEAVVVDHALQPGSAEVAERAASQCRELGLPARVIAVRVGSGGGPEAAARRARYAALEEYAGEGVPILTAHTLDDQAETVLLGIGRGSGARSLSGIPARRGALVRPFLGLRHDEAVTICRVYALAPWSDPHNVDPAYRRVRIRRELLPLMEEILGGGVAEALARTAEQLQRDATYLDAVAGDWLLAHADLVAEDLVSLDPALRSRVLRQAALAAGAIPGELSAAHLAELDRLVTDYVGQVRIELPGQVSVTRQHNRINFRRDA